MKSNREPSAESENSTHVAVTRRRALLGAGGVAASALAGCLGSGASGSSGGSSSGGSTPSGDTLPAPVQGNPQANVTVAAYEDYACPHCQTYVLDVLPQVESQYIKPGNIRYEHHDLPIPVSDPQSYTAANAARAVQSRTNGKEFWTYSRSLFQNQSSLGPDLYERLANQMGLKGQAVRKAAVNRKYKATIMADKQQGINKGVSATPTIFVNGNKLSEYSFDAISSAIESAK
jgi:protein-disulfide isomerase